MLKGSLNASFQGEVWGGTGRRTMTHIRFNTDKNFLKKNYRPIAALCCFYTKKKQLFVIGRFYAIYKFRKRLRSKLIQKAS